MSDTLTLAQQQALQAAVDRLIPTDDFPGGWEAGVGAFFALLLTREPRFLQTYQHGLAALDAEARATGAAAFAALPTDAQDALLARIELGDVAADWPLDPRAFFRLLVEQTTEGFYADPGNGGNRDGIGWDMIGYRVTT